ncbi:iron permease [Conexibacter sp. W3-3-2]|uniref:FTR1 family protein n=1 Tax=Conexibacter sp. W3-3-2 TaxID=2675227 RepID=UPI0012B786C5|nr:FTR1 family protein [Conexibacter sp. W3-3-2]MTD45883.1 iron permease [Conexibacter sp. W3-3-2]
MVSHTVGDRTADTPTPARPQAGAGSGRRLLVWALGLLVLGGAVYLMATASTGPVDPTEASAPQSRGTVIFNASMIVFREGLEAILIFAAIIASFQGANATRRRPVVLGAGVSFLAAIATWFAVGALLDAASPLGARLEAITGFIAIVVLLLVLNWFVHKVYWTGWIAKHHRQRRKVLGRVGVSATFGLVALGFTSVYREGFEVVLFLQNLKLTAGSGVVLEGVALGLAATALVGLVTFRLQRSLPYKKMLISTGVLIGVVLVVMVGGTALSFIDLGWIPGHATPFTVPEWMGSWFEVYSYWETLAAQALAAVFVIGSYYAAEYVRVKRPRRRGEAVAQRAAVAPTA